MVAASEIVLLGASGWLGERLANEVHPQVLNLRDLRPVDQKAGFLFDLDSALRTLGASTVVNLVGARKGSLYELRVANTLVPALLGECAARNGLKLVHVGSAAEYGLDSTGEPITESLESSPSSNYGATKLEGTLQLLAALPSATVLRPFNIIAARNSVESPVSDVLQQVRTAALTRQSIKLRSAGTIRDFVSWQYVVSSLKYAISNPVPGVYNLCSGRGNTIADLAKTVSRLAGVDVGVTDLQETAPSAVVGNPKKWAAASSLIESTSLSWKLRTSLGERIDRE